ncbi:AraC-like DNA-binding protein [Duganella sp. 1224]|uniref:AraC family transcriptional regulator n=1 Tax=Duganella sp. 1224 TaxID=2587052 RepID=UPI0015CA1F2C|nr:AraC family transcriptional regulator [Duganella sp. 1224]NYE59919.1 AraC-like DNA-binding protein [Duganella sp. 1224]
MKLSQSSKPARDPLSDVLEVLGAKVTRLTRMEAAGEWALAFPAIDRLKFVAMLRGSQWMVLPGREPQLLREGDICLIGRTAYVVASDPALTPLNGQDFYGANCDVARFGGDDTIGIGGSVTFAASNADFLLDRLPEFLIVPRASPASAAIAALLALVSKELERDMMGSEVVTTRLADVLVVEAIRAYAAHASPLETGWLGAVADLRLGRALRAIHDDLAQPWTVAGLASVAGMSRAAFCAEFTRRIGQPPLAYLRAWRLTTARTALLRSDATVALVASRVGYTSQSAFTHAFRRAFGCAPKSH